MSTTTQPDPGRRWAWLALGALVVATIAAVAIPGVLIHPFHPQSARDVHLSFSLRRAAYSGGPVAVALVVLAAVYLWKNARWYTRTALVALALVTGGAAWFARQMPFEWMFNPIAGPQFARAAEAAHWAQDADAVMALTLNGESVAYPIRQMAYHHIVHDVVGGIPVVVTY